MVGQLAELIINEKHRGKGYGNELLNEIIVQAKNRDAIEIHFSSTFKREKAHEFYKKKGFHKTAYYFWKEI